MIAEIQKILKKFFPANSTRILVIGVSGGPDSLCLLDGLHWSGRRVVAAHLNHRLRAEADQEAEFVRQAAAGYGIPCVIEAADVAGHAERNSLSIEEAARNVRYRFLFAVAKRWDAQAVVVGHTADDQVETILMHLLRGAGMDGLSGMEPWQIPNAWSQEIPLARPLLEVWREETLVYCQQRGLEPVMDESNQEATYFRNRLRHELVPALEAYAPHLKSKLLTMTEILQGDQAVLDAVVESAWQGCVWQEGEGYVALRRGQFLSQLLGVQRRLARRAISRIRPGLRDIGFETVERFRNFVQQPTASRQMDLAAGLRMLAEDELAWVAAWEADLPGMGVLQMENPAVVIRLPVPGTVLLQGGGRLCAEEADDLVDARQLAQRNESPYQAWLDADGLSDELVVRGRKRGDRCKPLGMDGHTVKISDLMINARLPRRARSGWPLVCCGDEVVWVPGYAASHLCRVKAETRRIFHLWLTGEDQSTR